MVLNLSIWTSLYRRGTPTNVTTRDYRKVKKLLGITGCTCEEEKWQASLLCGLSPTKRCDEKGFVPHPKNWWHARFARKLGMVFITRSGQWILAGRDASGRQGKDSLHYPVWHVSVPGNAVWIMQHTGYFSTTYERCLQRDPLEFHRSLLGRLERALQDLWSTHWPSQKCIWTIERSWLEVEPRKMLLQKTRIVFPWLCHQQKWHSTDSSKIEKVQNFLILRTLTQLWEFLGLASYYRKFIKGFFTITNSLNKLLKKNIPYNWTEAQQAAFDHLKQCLVTAPILIYPDFEEEFLLYTDASTFGLGAILAQVDKEGNDRVVVYASRTLRCPEKNYSATELECLAVVWAVGYLHAYIHGKRFTLITDNCTSI